MADHISEQIMIQIGTLLTGLFTTQTRVKRSRLFTVEGDNGLTYEMGAEEPTEGEINYQVMDVDLTVIVKAFTKSPDPEIELKWSPIHMIIIDPRTPNAKFGAFIL